MQCPINNSQILAEHLDSVPAFHLPLIEGVIVLHWGHLHCKNFQAEYGMVCLHLTAPGWKWAALGSAVE